MTESFPNSDSDGTDDHVERIDVACDAYEFQWRRGQHPRIEEFLVRARQADRARLLKELIALDVQLRRAAGEDPLKADYHQRFREHPATVDSAFLTLAGADLSPEESGSSPEGAGSSPEGAGPERLPSTAGPKSEDLRRPPSDGIELPEAIGRYRIRRVLGWGGFAVVYLADDPALGRQVALKVPRAERFSSEKSLNHFLWEARQAARLDHPRVVRIYDVQRDENRIYIVQQYISGGDLTTFTSKHVLSYHDIAQLMLRVAQAVGYAHKQGCWHRDLKPANILIDAWGEPFVADFGMSLHESNQWHRAGEKAGTPAYMSPEQVRGESHRLDGRSDIWSLGVILYELLTGRRPFAAPTTEQLEDEIVYRDPRPPRMLDPTVPHELARIAMSCLAKRASDRYQSASDLEDDLDFWLTGSDPSSSASVVRNVPAEQIELPVNVLPKGLRSFELADADFFLQLLPGPHDREGLPKSIRFWKTMIEQTEAEEASPIGLMYGPSGCGKTSFVKAGLLPRISESVLPIYIESTGIHTEDRLIRALHKYCPELTGVEDLTNLLLKLRIAGGFRGRKVLIVLDQFEQWLHSHAHQPRHSLIQALRQCDGTSVQCLVLVRDDFWMSATRFMQAVEVPLTEGVNSAAVDLFDTEHSYRVLTAFGRAFGRLPSPPQEPARDQQQFLFEAIEGLAEGGKIVPVRLVVFSEMMKSRRWTVENLREVGGTEGIGVTFLEETFGAKTAPPTHRLHQDAARNVLRTLLPDHGSDIRGQMKAYEDLLNVSGYRARPDDFEALLSILDRELRLITPTELAGSDLRDDEILERHGKYYQLTHDYLVGSLRDWLTRKQRETWRGRIRLRLAERAALWNAKRESRQLPAWWELIGINLATRRGDWTVPQRTMMRHAERRFLIRAAILMVIVTLCGVAGLISYKAASSRIQVQRIKEADVDHVLGMVAALDGSYWWSEPELRRNLADPATEPQQRWRLQLALLPRDESQLEPLAESMLSERDATFRVLREGLFPYRNVLSDLLWETAVEADSDTAFAAASALALYEPEDPRWTQIADGVADYLVSQPPLSLVQASRNVMVVRHHLRSPLLDRSQTESLSDSARMNAIECLALYYHDDLDLMVELTTESHAADVFLRLLPHLEDASANAKVLLEAIVHDDSLPATWLEAERVADRKANSALALLRLGAPGPTWVFLQRSPNPRVRTRLVDRLHSYGVPITSVLNRLEEETDDGIRHALILALGSYSPGLLPVQRRKDLESLLLGWHHDVEDSGVTAAIEWLVRKWGWSESPAELLRDLATGQTVGNRNWYLTRNGWHTLIVLNPQEPFWIGSPDVDKEREGDWEDRVLRRIPRTYAMSTKEVRLAQRRAAGWKAESEYESQIAEHTPTPDYPVTYITWYDAAGYCNWLTRTEGLGEDQVCYAEDAEGRVIGAAKDSLMRTGYRLPTEAEWEYACRAGTDTSRYFGSSPDLLDRYEWYYLNSRRKRLSLGGTFKPNDFGLFDMLGNVAEWCHQPSAISEPERLQGLEAPVIDSESPIPVSENSPPAVRGGKMSDLPEQCRSSHRHNWQPGLVHFTIGFRLARTLSHP